MKVLGIDHIGIAVASIEEALRFYEGQLGLSADPIEERPASGIRICRVHAGAVELELIEAGDWNATMQRFLPHQGPGVYHVGLRVADVDACVEELVDAGVPVIDHTPREGENMRISFLAPEAAQGTMFELVTRTGKAQGTRHKDEG